MPAPISPEMKGRILALGALNWSRSVICKELKKENLAVSNATVSRVLASHNNAIIGQAINGPKPKIRRRARILTPRKVNKVKNFIASDNPLTQSDIARRVGVSQQSVSRLVRGDLDCSKKKKVVVHHLTQAAIAQRKERALHFFSLIANENYKDILTMDETMMPLDGQNGIRDFYYRPNNPENRKAEEPMKVGKPGWPKQRMAAMGYGWYGQTQLYVVDSKAKVNAELFIEYILKPMMFEDVPRLYGPNADRVVLHMDSAPAHVALPVNQWLTEHGFKFIRKDEWLANSPDLSPMDFFANGYFKCQLKKRKFTTENGMIKCAADEWANIPLEMFRNSLRSWPDRVWAVHKAKGKQVPKKAKRKIKN